mgnify:FL=1
MTKRVPISVRLTDDERAALDSAAAEVGLSISATIRLVLVQGLRRRGLLRKNGRAIVQGRVVVIGQRS